jgi:membrane protein required for beta-lactamase induction
MPTRRRALLVIAVLLAAGLLSLAGALLVGSYSIAPGEVWRDLSATAAAAPAPTSCSACACRARWPPSPAAPCWHWPAP